MSVTFTAVLRSRHVVRVVLLAVAIALCVVLFAAATDSRVLTLTFPAGASAGDVFQALSNVYRHRRAEPQRFRIAIADIGNDPSTHRPFDPREIAREYPQGAYGRFMYMLQLSLHDKASANSINPLLGDALIASSVRVEVSRAGSPRSDIRDSTAPNENGVTLKFCDANSNCAVVVATMMPDGRVDLSYQQSVDIARSRFPMPTSEKPAM